MTWPSTWRPCRWYSRRSDVVTACGPCLGDPWPDSPADNPTAGGLSATGPEGFWQALPGPGATRGAVFAGIADPDAFAALQAGPARDPAGRHPAPAAAPGSA